MGMKKAPPKRGPGRPATGKSPIRYFRMEDDQWAIIEQAASQADKTGFCVDSGLSVKSR